MPFFDPPPPPLREHQSTPRKIRPPVHVCDIPDHRRFTLQLGALWQCPECRRCYELDLRLSGIRYWARISKRRARRILDKAGVLGGSIDAFNADSPDNFNL